MPCSDLYVREGCSPYCGDDTGCLGQKEVRCNFRALRSSYTTRTKCAISDAFVRDCVFAYCASVVQYVYSLSAEHCFRLRKNAITDERVRDCALSTHSVFRPLDLGIRHTRKKLPSSLYWYDRISQLVYDIRIHTRNPTC